MSRRCRRGCVCLRYGLRHVPLVNNLQNPRVTWINIVRRAVLGSALRWQADGLGVAHNIEGGGECKDAGYLKKPNDPDTHAAPGVQETGGGIPQSHTKIILTSMEWRDHPAMEEPSRTPCNRRGRPTSDSPETGKEAGGYTVKYHSRRPTQLLPEEVSPEPDPVPVPEVHPKPTQGGRGLYGMGCSRGL